MITNINERGIKQMAGKPKGFKLNENKKAIIIYTNVAQTEGDKTLIDLYLKAGYTPMTEEKKKGTSIAEMREQLKEDQETLKKFNDAYSEKGGFHKACKIYTDWMKKKKIEE